MFVCKPEAIATEVYSPGETVHMPRVPWPCVLCRPGREHCNNLVLRRRINVIGDLKPPLWRPGSTLIMNSDEIHVIAVKARDFFINWRNDCSCLTMMPCGTCARRNVLLFFARQRRESAWGAMHSKSKYSLHSSNKRLRKSSLSGLWYFRGLSCFVNRSFKRAG